MAHVGPGQKGLSGLSLRAVLNKKKKLSSLKDPPGSDPPHPIAKDRQNHMKKAYNIPAFGAFR